MPMARRQFLWIDPRGAGVNYLAPGNVSIGPGSKGTLSIWQWPLVEHYRYDLSWRVEVNANNYMRQYQGRTLQVCSQGVSKYATVNANTTVLNWDHMVYTWDFSVAGAGQISAYWNGSLVGSPVTGVSAPVGTATKLYLGPLLSTDSWGPSCIQSLAVWDTVAGSAAIAALYAEGHRHRVVASDGPGALTFYASFDGRYDADVAAGDATMRVEGAADRYALIDDGARTRARRGFLLGRPRHDLSSDDRVPLSAPCPVTLTNGRSPYVQDTNNTSYAELRVLAGYTANRRVGAAMGSRPVLSATGVAAPATYRQRVHIPNSDTPKGRTVRLGPVDYVHYPTKSVDVFDHWGSGRPLSVVSAAGNTAAAFKTNLDDRFETGYWTGAVLTVLTGNCAGRRLRVSAYDGSTKVMTLETALPAVPSAGSLAVVDFRARLQGCRSWGSATHGQRLPEMSTDAWLWEFYGGAQLFTELEWQFAGVNTADLLVPNMLRYDRGRTALMDGAQHSYYENGAAYGKSADWDDNTLACRILLESLEVDGPTTYQSLARSADGSGPDYADNFMLAAPDGESTKIWRNVGCQRTKARPTKFATPSLVRADLEAAGTWRQTAVSFPVPVEYDEAADVVVAALTGADAQGVQRIGYVRGRWDAVAGRVRWEDEAAPSGRANPFILVSDLRTAANRDAAVRASSLTAVVQNSDGTWSLVYSSQASHPDHFMAYMLCGASDRWSFSAAQHWWSGNPIVPIVGGPDTFSPESNGSGQWANRDADWRIVANPHATDPAERVWGFARGKSINHRANNYAVDLRPLIGVRGADLRSMSPLPHGNAVSPLVGPLVHDCECAVLGQADCFGLYTDTAISFSSGVFCYVSEDGIHFQQFAADTDWIPRSELVGEPARLSPGRPFRLGDRRIYYYGADPFVNFASCRLDGEVWYELASAATAGLVETPALTRPPRGWGRLRVNGAPNGGAVTLEVLDADTECVLPGFGAAEFERMGDAVEHVARWSGVGLDHVTATSIRLRFRLSRPSTGVTTPRLYAWRAEEASGPLRPTVSDLRVQGLEDPTGVIDPTPEFAWTYADANGFPQAGFHVIVSSSRENLDAGIGDVWDSGQLTSAAASVVFAGGALASESVYYWRVRVRNTLGVWSEEW
jgi:hypothetical protein